jgi:TetR/AcrR family transcriptional repressor of nem operon
MPKPSNREKILAEGMRVVHERGYSGASVRDIANAAGVPLGSFTSHFSSKEAFSLEVLNQYFSANEQLVARTLQNESISPLERLQYYLDTIISSLNQNGCWNGCLIGNFCAEASEHSELIRKRLVEIFNEMESAIGTCLQAAVDAGELRAEIDCADIAAFTISSLQGAILQSKAERCSIPVERFKRVLFTFVLCKNDS